MLVLLFGFSQEYEVCRKHGIHPELAPSVSKSTESCLVHVALELLLYKIEVLKSLWVAASVLRPCWIERRRTLIFSLKSVQLFFLHVSFHTAVFLAADFACTGMLLAMESLLLSLLRLPGLSYLAWRACPGPRNRQIQRSEKTKAFIIGNNNRIGPKIAKLVLRGRVSSRQENHYEWSHRQCMRREGGEQATWPIQVFGNVKRKPNGGCLPRI